MVRHMAPRSPLALNFHFEIELHPTRAAMTVELISAPSLPWTGGCASEGSVTSERARPVTSGPCRTSTAPPSSSYSIVDGSLTLLHPAGLHATLVSSAREQAAEAERLIARREREARMQKREEAAARAREDEARMKAHELALHKEKEQMQARCEVLPRQPEKWCMRA